RIEGKGARLPCVFDEVGVTEISEKGWIGAHPAEEGNSAPLVARLLGQLSYGRICRVFLFHEPAGYLEADLMGTVAVLPYHDYFPLRGDGYHVDPTAGLQRVEFVDAFRPRRTGLFDPDLEDPVISVYP